MRREAKGACWDEAKHTRHLGDKTASSPLSGSTTSFIGNVDSGRRRGCYQLTRSESQGKGREADKLSGAWELCQARAHDLPCFVLADHSWGCGLLSGCGLVPGAEWRGVGGDGQPSPSDVPPNVSCLYFPPKVYTRIPHIMVLYPLCWRGTLWESDESQHLLLWKM